MKKLYLFRIQFELLPYWNEMPAKAKVVLIPGHGISKA